MTQPTTGERTLEPERAEDLRPVPRHKSGTNRITQQHLRLPNINRHRCRVPPVRTPKRWSAPGLRRYINKRSGDQPQPCPRRAGRKPPGWPGTRSLRLCMGGAVWCGIPLAFPGLPHSSPGQNH